MNFVLGWGDMFGMLSAVAFSAWLVFVVGPEGEAAALERNCICTDN